MFSTNKYSKRTISTFEIIGSFVVDVYYNHLYHEAKKLHAFGKVESTTEGYKCEISTYIKSLSHPDHYKKTLLGVHRYYSTTTKFTNITFSDCMNSISKQFMPEDLHESMSESQKDGMIRVVLTAAIKNFSVEILKGKLLKMIIDDHDSDGIVRTLQDAMVECLVFEREKMYQKIFSSQNGVEKDAGVSSKMRKTIEELMAGNKQLAAANIKLTAKNKQLEQYVSQCIALLKKQKEALDSQAEASYEARHREDRHHRTEFARREEPRESSYGAKWHEPVREPIEIPFEPHGRDQQLTRDPLPHEKITLASQDHQDQKKQEHQEYLEQAKARHRERQEQEKRGRNGWDEPVVEVIKLPSEEMGQDVAPQPLTYRHQLLDWEEPPAEPQSTEPADDNFLDIS